MTTTTVTSIPSLISKANAGIAGDVFLLADGTYINTSRTAVTKSGVVIKAANPLKAIIKGAPIDLSGSGITFEGFDLQYSTTEQTVIHIDGADTKFLRNKIHFANPISTRQDWLNVRADNCLINNNEIFGKVGMGNPILVGSGSLIVKGTKIIGNHIHDQSGGTGNGAETIRLGSSATAKAPFGTEIAGNRIENCSTSDDELITVKSSNNDIHDNTLINNDSGITFRHGSYNKFRNNININSGFRMYGHNQEITGNQFLRNSHSQLKQVVVGAGDHVDDGVLGVSNAIYSQVHDCLFQNNLFVGEDVDQYYLFCWGYSTSSYKPVNNTIRNNVFTASKGTLAHTKDGASWTGNVEQGNVLWPTGSAVLGDMPGTKQDPKLVNNADGTYSFSSTSPLQWTITVKLLTALDVGPFAQLITPVPTPTPTPTPTDIDKFGVKKLHPTKTNGEEWFMNTINVLNDSRVIPSSSITSSHIQMNPDGSFKMIQSTDQDNRLNILTTGGYDHSKCVLDWNVLKTRGYMQNPQDWRNVEITGYARVNKVYQVSGHSLVWYARGGHHSTSYPCEGNAYKGNILYTGDTRFQKESGHPNYATTNSVHTGLSGSFLGKWFGYKFICYDLPDGSVKLENWLDLTNDNNWVKVLEKTDTSGWGTNPSNCGGTQDQKFTWGGPQAVFRFDSALDIDFKKLSVREITT